MSHPDPHGPPDCTPIKLGEVWENLATKERATIMELPWDNPEGRATSETIAFVGSRVTGEHRHPVLVERFTVLEGDLTVKRNGQTSVLPQAETAGGDAERDLWLARTDRLRARLSRDVPANLAQRAGSAGVAGGWSRY